jgi:ribosomal protein S18 acetylase RimI-like enzyme
MTTSGLTVRALTASEAPRYNAFFAEGARAHPDTLRIAPEDIEASPFSTAESAEGATFVAEAGDGRWLGVGTVEREGGRMKRRHVAWIVRMYVTAEAAGRGVGRAILRQAMARAGAMAGVSKVNLTVAAHNAAAIHLYASEGFREFAREEDAFRDAEPRAELSMSAPVRPTIGS